MKGYNDADRDERGLFSRFLPPTWRTVTKPVAQADMHSAVVFSIEKMLTVAEVDLKASKQQSYIATATGEYLDIWGNNVGLPRKANEEDEDYRARLLKYLTQLRSTIPALVDVLEGYFGDSDTDIFIYEPFRNIFHLNRSDLDGLDHLQGHYYRYAVIDIHIDRPFDYAEVMALIDKHKPAGVIVHLTSDYGRGEGAPIYDGLSKIKAGMNTTISEYLHGLENYTQATFTLGEYLNGAEEKELFTTNDSLLDGTNVLAGAFGTGRPSYNGSFTAKNITVKGSESVAQLISKGKETDASVYASTRDVDSLKADITLAKGEYLYQALDYGTFYETKVDTGVLEGKVRYIRVSTINSPHGVNWGEIGAYNAQGVNLAEGKSIKYAVKGVKAYRTVLNGVNISQPTERNFWGILDLGKEQDVKAVSLQSQYPTAVEEMIEVSLDGYTYVPAWVGKNLKGKYTLKTLPEAIGLGEGAEYLGSRTAHTSLTISIQAYSGRRLTTEVYNYASAKWEVAMVQESYKQVKQTHEFSDLRHYVSATGVMLSRISVDGGDDISLDYYGIGLVLWTGRKNHLNLPINIAGSGTTIQQEAGVHLWQDYFPSNIVHDIQRFPIGEIAMDVITYQDIYDHPDGSLDNVNKLKLKFTTDPVTGDVEVKKVAIFDSKGTDISSLATATIEGTSQSAQAILTGKGIRLAKKGKNEPTVLITLDKAYPRLGDAVLYMPLGGKPAYDGIVMSASNAPDTWEIVYDTSLVGPLLPSSSGHKIPLAVSDWFTLSDTSRVIPNSTQGYNSGAFFAGDGLPIGYITGITTFGGKEVHRVYLDGGEVYTDMPGYAVNYKSVELVLTGYLTKEMVFTYGSESINIKSDTYTSKLTYDNVPSYDYLVGVVGSYRGLLAGSDVILNNIWNRTWGSLYPDAPEETVPKGFFNTTWEYLLSDTTTSIQMNAVSMEEQIVTKKG